MCTGTKRATIPASAEPNNTYRTAYGGSLTSVANVDNPILNSLFRQTGSRVEEVGKDLHRRERFVGEVHDVARAITHRSATRVTPPQVAQA